MAANSKNGYAQDYGRKSSPYLWIVGTWRWSPQLFASPQLLWRSSCVDWSCFDVLFDHDIVGLYGPNISSVRLWTSYQSEWRSNAWSKSWRTMGKWPQVSKVQKLDTCYVLLSTLANFSAEVNNALCKWVIEWFWVYKFTFLPFVLAIPTARLRIDTVPSKIISADFQYWVIFVSTTSKWNLFLWHRVARNFPVIARTVIRALTLLLPLGATLLQALSDCINQVLSTLPLRCATLRADEAFLPRKK